MFNNTVLDIFIGLVFIYLLYSLLATILQEMLARWLSLRTHNLTYAIRVMLEDRNEEDKGCEIWKLIARYFKSQFFIVCHFFIPFPRKTFTRAFYSHPTIKYLGESEWKRKPAYLRPETFSQTVIQLLRGEEYDASQPQINYIEDTLFRKKSFKANINGRDEMIVIGQETLRHLRHIFHNAQRDSDRFKAMLEDWFNETMERAAGWYKRTVQFTLLIIGFLLALWFNIDTIAIYKLLSIDKTVREQMVQLATANTDKYEAMIKNIGYVSVGVPKVEVDSIGKKVVHIRDTVFVSDKTLKSTMDSVMRDGEKAQSLFSVSKKYQSDDSKIFGWLLTALAISLGAPFWFDLLNKLIQLRSTGPKPDTTSDPAIVKETSSVKRVG
ncbi:hypothetical protein ACTJJ0_03305 [Chitinophaga sp. 22321]|uniref:Uncharacterized protein n=1 Tax=Chitinophaga hostae TaxID=2831022 RepID=A0ABS5IXI8_9BACT|nr:hypothetical protein [Chitinophaga hostae]MBS0027669.1 hypothetical protein [Chitinophaga hostae]